VPWDNILSFSTRCGSGTNGAKPRNMLIITKGTRGIESINLRIFIAKNQMETYHLHASIIQTFYIQPTMLDTFNQLEKIRFPPISRSVLQTLQLNLGYKCNQQCQHCHVNAGPNRTEMMTDETLEAAKTFAIKNNIKVIDLTGGAPEMHPKFRDLVTWASKQNIKVIDRCNLTILFEPGQEDLADFLHKSEVEIVASMPCYLEENVNKQRGKGVFDKSIKGLQLLNSLGFGKPGSSLTLNLVYNPQGASLPPSQDGLEKDYKEYLYKKYQIEFNNLLTITNLPIARFGSMLLSKGEFDDYMQLLRDNFTQDNLDKVMCKTLLSVDWQGNIYDCDFNQMLGLKTQTKQNGGANIANIQNADELNHAIEVMGHCYGCTAGQGSSCSGAL
jgi:radical SAM/Cys-rich protein